jgi:hypothetical protein
MISFGVRRADSFRVTKRVIILTSEPKECSYSRSPPAALAVVPYFS